jgi:hypothetical protein
VPFAEIVDGMTRFALIAAPVLMIIGRLLTVPHDDQRRTAYIQQVADHPVRSDTGAALTLFASTLLIPVVLALTAAARGRNPRFGRVAGALSIIGCVGTAGVATVSLVAGQLARHTPLDVAATIWGHLALDLGPVDLMVLLGVLGFLLLGVALFRSRSVPRGAAVLAGLGGAATMITSQGPIRALVVGTAVVLLAGTGWIAAGLQGDHVGVSADAGDVGGAQQETVDVGGIRHRQAQ